MAESDYTYEAEVGLTEVKVILPDGTSKKMEIDVPGVSSEQTPRSQKHHAQGGGDGENIGEMKQRILMENHFPGDPDSYEIVIHKAQGQIDVMNEAKCTSQYRSDLCRAHDAKLEIRPRTGVSSSPRPSHPDSLGVDLR